MRPPRWPLGLVAPLALVALVGALATLQYRWVGQVSEAARDQIRESLDRRAREFADDFDRELGRTYALLEPQPGFSVDTPDQFARQFDAWLSTARFPGIIKSVHFVRGSSDGLEIHRYLPEARRFEPVSEWPEALAVLRRRLASSFSAPLPTDASVPRVIAFTSSTVAADVPALIFPIPERITNPVEFDKTKAPLSVQERKTTEFLMALRLSHSHLIVALDKDRLTTEVLPVIANAHFPESGSDRSRVSILDASSTPVLSRGLAADESIEPNRADAAAAFFTVRPTLHRESSMSWSVPRAPATVETRSFVSVEPLAAASRYSMVIQGRPDPATNAVTAAATTAIGIAAGTGSWRILLQHPAGSLDAAVGQVRRRNLWLSFGILTVLVSSVGLIVMNARRAERLAAQQMDFVATVSHELRTPLAVIRSAAQNLSAGVVHDPTQARRYGDLIESEGRRLTDMVEQVLEYAGLSGNRKNVAARPVDVGSLVEDVVSLNSALPEAEGIEFETSIPDDLPPVIGNMDDLRRALQNLVGNALKYGTDGRWIGITAARITSRGRDEVQVTVSDRGRGIDPNDLAHIFEPFYRGRDAMDRQIHGNGLGLNLVQRIVEAQDGRVTVKSAPGEGAAFTLHLPAMTTAPSAALADGITDTGAPGQLREAGGPTH